MRPNYEGYTLSKRDDKKIIKDNLKQEYQEYLDRMNLEQLKTIAKSYSFELKGVQPLDRWLKMCYNINRKRRVHKWKLK